MFSQTIFGFVLYFVLPALGFDIYWNVPSQQCKNNYGIDLAPLLSNYGILVNDGDKFQGGNITIFYESQLGLYPKISKFGKLENGGIPQRANLSNHLDQAALDIKRILPDRDFNGLGVIDWESWRPAWDLNWEPLRIYQEKSKEFAKESNPSIDSRLLPEIAKSQWEQSAKYFMLETLLLAKKIRPRARWCYYLFPDCYNYEGKNPEEFVCSKAVQLLNDRIDWLWQSSTAICPSVYLYKNHLDKYSLDQRVWKDHGKLKEAVRVAAPKAKIYPYVNYFLDKETMPQEEFERLAAQTASVGGDGLVIWSSSASVSTQSLCNDLKAYIIKSIGPVVEKVAWKSNVCSKKICNGRGKCTWPEDKSVSAWRLFRIESAESFNARDIVCNCEEGYAGRFCEK